jgi:hypothetical protein
MKRSAALLRVRALLAPKQVGFLCAILMMLSWAAPADACIFCRLRHRCSCRRVYYYYNCQPSPPGQGPGNSGTTVPPGPPTRPHTLPAISQVPPAIPPLVVPDALKKK